MEVPKQTLFKDLTTVCNIYSSFRKVQKLTTAIL